jgi:hypothetical protein
MSTCFLEETLPEINHKLIYVYDFLQMWSFYVEVVDINTETITESKLILSVGEIPEEAPEKEFIAEKNEDDSFDGEFDSLDDYDFTDY